MKSMLTATMAVLLSFNPSYGSLIEASNVDTPFKGSLHVDFVGWLKKYSGDYTFIGIQHGKPAYNLTKCRYPDNCLEGQILSAGAGIVGERKYQFGECAQCGSTNCDQSCMHPTCLKVTDTPEICEDWGVGQQPKLSRFGDYEIEIPLCGEVTGDTFKDRILSTFNCYRSQVALGNVKSLCVRNDCEDGEYLPKAAKMSALVWNDELAQQAQDCVSTKVVKGFYCTSEHCDGAGNQGGAAWSGWEQYKEQYGVIMWVDEKKRYKWGDNQSLSGDFWGVIKENHAEIGCGYKFCPQNDGRSPYQSRKALYCNYKNKPKVDLNEDETYPYTKTNGAAGSECNSINLRADSLTGLCY